MSRRADRPHPPGLLVLGEHRHRQRDHIDALQSCRGIQHDAQRSADDHGIDDDQRPGHLVGGDLLHPRPDPPHDLDPRLASRRGKGRVPLKGVDRCSVLGCELHQGATSPAAQLLGGDGCQPWRTHTEPLCGGARRSIAAAPAKRPQAEDAVPVLGVVERLDVASAGEHQVALVDLGKAGHQYEPTGHRYTTTERTVPGRTERPPSIWLGVHAFVSLRHPAKAGRLGRARP